MQHFQHVATHGTGTIIIVNGPSASGKSAIIKSWQETTPEPYLNLGIDNSFVRVLPAGYMGGTLGVQQLPPEYVAIGRFVEQNDGQIFELIFGPWGRKVISGMHKAIAAYADTGNNIAVDYIQYHDDWLPELVQTLKNYRVYFVGVRIPLEILEQRERTRLTSPVGHARSHYYDVHRGAIYDVEVDTGSMSPQECVQVIKEHIAQHEPKALAQMVQKFGV